MTLAILTLAGIAFALQQTMVIPALPTLQQDLEHDHDLGHLGPDGLPARGLRRDADPRQARRPVREGAAARDLAGALLHRLDRRGRRLEHLVADRLARPSGRRRGRLPAQLRDHPRRVSAREGRRRDRARLGGVRDRRRARDRALRRDRGSRLVALAVHRRGRRNRQRRSCSCSASFRSRRSRRRRASTSSARRSCPAD